jgi:glycosyltransferase involved in cell wall biosynthesis
LVFAFRRSSATLVLLMAGNHHAPRLSVIVAVRDVEDSIGRDVRSLAAHLRARGIAFEILAASDGSCDTSLTLLRFLSAEIPELTVVGLARSGRAFRRAVAHAQGDAVLLWQADRGMTLPFAVLGWALSRLVRKAAVIVRGRFVLASRMRALPVLLETSGRWDDYEVRFERLAADLGLDVEIVGQRSRRRSRRLWAPVLRILSV